MSRRTLIGRRQVPGLSAFENGSGPSSTSAPAATIAGAPPPRRPGTQRRRTIPILLGLGLAPLAAAALLASLVGGGAIVGQVNTRAADASRQAAGAFDQLISSHLTAMEGVADDLAVLALAEHNPGANPAPATADLENLARSQPQIWGIALTDTLGSPVAAVGTQDPLVGLPDDWRAELAHGGSIGTGAPPVGGGPSVVLAVAVLKGGGSPGGFLVERCGLGTAAAELRSLAAAQGMTLLLLQRDGGLILGASGLTGGGTETPVTRWAPSSSVMAATEAALRSRGVEVSDQGGIPTAVGPVTPVAWVVLASLPAAALTPVSNLNLTVLSVCGALALLFLVGVGLVDRAFHQQERTESDLIAESARMAHAAMHDPLTGLPNRLLFTDRLQHGISNARRAGRGMALFVVDLDGFKALNDSLGHSIGDVLLRETADRLQASVRASDTVARLGGDEFAIVAVDADRADAELIQAKIRQRMDEPFTLEDGQVAVRLSIGLAVFPEDGTDSAPLLRRADIDMYRDKRSRKAGLS